MKTFHKVCEILFWVGFINFFLFMIVSVFLGGDALNGKIVEGHYYLASNGQLREVSSLVFTYSKIHVYSIFITHSLAAIALLANWVTGGKFMARKNKWW